MTPKPRRLPANVNLAADKGATTSLVVPALPKTGNPPIALPATVHVIEPTGSETQVVMHLGDASVIGAFRERIAARPGETLPVSPDTSLVHLFDKATGRRL